MGKKTVGQNTRIRRSSGNVFADLTLPKAAERQTKVQLAVALNRAIESGKLSQVDAANRLGISQPKVSALRNYKLEGFSVERLIRLVTALDYDVEIVIRNHRRTARAGRINVRRAA